jgi:hypothetical protein
MPGDRQSPVDTTDTKRPIIVISVLAPESLLDGGGTMKTAMNHATQRLYELQTGVERPGTPAGGAR